MNKREHQDREDFDEAVDERLEEGTDAAEDDPDEAVSAFRKQRDEDEDSVLEEKEDSPVKPDNS